MSVQLRSAPGRRVMLVTSSGGVLLDLLALRPWWADRDTFWVAVRAPDTATVLAAHNVRWERELHAGSPISVLRSLATAFRIMRRDRPQILLSAGSGVAVPYFVAARLLGIHSVWLSTLNLISTAGLAARVCSRLASAVLVQRPTMVRAHPGAIVVGDLY